jgi:hypothetical protein
LTTHINLLLWLRMVELYHHFPIHLHGVVLNYFRTGATLILLALGPAHPHQGVPGSLFPEVKRQVSRAYPSLPSNGEINSASSWRDA